MSLGRQIRRYAIELAALLAIVAAGLVVGAYILSHQRLRFPWEDVYVVQADFSSGQAITPGQGQTVAVSGVTVGEIVRVELVEGKARVRMEINRDKLAGVHRDARMLVRPKTGLQDMTIELDPGTPRAGRLDPETVLPSSQTQPNVNADEVLENLDQDTRAWLQTIVTSGRDGLAGRGGDLRRIFKAAAPTLRQTRQVTDAIVARRADLQQLVHDLGELAGVAAGSDDELRELVGSGNAALGAIAREDAALRTSLQLLPGTLEEARRTLTATRPFARELGPAARELRPAIKELLPALPALDPLLRDARPAAAQIRELVGAAKPVVRDARPALRDLRKVTPELSKAFDVLTRVVNEMAFNPPGDEEGYLFWAAWYFHNAASILSIEDAHGVAWRGGLITSCSTMAALGELEPVLAAFVQSPACPADPAKAARREGG